MDKLQGAGVGVRKTLSKFNFQCLNTPPVCLFVNGNSHMGLRLNGVMFVGPLLSAWNGKSSVNSHSLLLLPGNQNREKPRGAECQGQVDRAGLCTCQGMGGDREWRSAPGLAGVCSMRDRAVSQIMVIMTKLETNRQSGLGVQGRRVSHLLFMHV